MARSHTGIGCMSQQSGYYVPLPLTSYQMPTSTAYSTSVTGLAPHVSLRFFACERYINPGEVGPIIGGQVGVHVPDFASVKLHGLLDIWSCQRRVAGALVAGSEFADRFSCTRLLLYGRSTLVEETRDVEKDEIFRDSIAVHRW